MKEDELGKLYANGEGIFKEGQEGDRMYVIQTGKVKITKKSPSMTSFSKLWRYRYVNFPI